MQIVWKLLATVRQQQIEMLGSCFNEHWGYVAACFSQRKLTSRQGLKSAEKENTHTLVYVCMWVFVSFYSGVLLPTGCKPQRMMPSSFMELLKCSYKYEYLAAAIDVEPRQW